MIICTPISTPARHVIRFTGRVGRQMSVHVRSVVSCLPSNGRCSYFHLVESRPRNVSLTISRTLSCSSAIASQAFQGCRSVFSLSKQGNNNSLSLTVKSLVNCKGNQTSCLGPLGSSLPCQKKSLSFSFPKQVTVSKLRRRRGYATSPSEAAFTSIIFGSLVCFSSTNTIHAEAAREDNNKKDECDSSLVSSSHGKKVHTDYSITGIPGDGRCLFRSVSHGACLRSGKPSPTETLQKQLADELRAMVADEFVRRREESEWFVEGDFDTYVSHIRKPHVWGGEPELFMASHVLKMPITVYMYDDNAGGLISIAEYGQEYGKEDPIKVLYHGFGHYDALQIPGTKPGKSRL